MNRPADRVAVRVTPDALRRIRHGHPWVFDRSIRSVKPAGSTGDLAVVFDDRRRFAAIGLYDPNQPIAIRVLHVGKPVQIDAHWWEGRVREAMVHRAALVADLEAATGDGPAPGYRVVNGENDGLPGLVVDRYADVLVVKLYTAAWFPHLDAVIGAACGVTGASSVVVRLSRHVAARPGRVADGDVIAGRALSGVPFSEWGLAFEADVRIGQKTGYFLDQRENRRRIGRLAAGRDVLDVFSATGGFAVHAAAGGARSVHSIDASAPTLNAARRNMARNAHRPDVVACRYTTESGDAFEAMRRIATERRRYGVVVVDPPSFAQRAADVDRALGAYRRLAELAVRLVEPDGVLMLASCSSRVGEERFFEAVGSPLGAAGAVAVDRTGHDVDHPVTFPEGAYLKAGFWRLPAGG